MKTILRRFHRPHNHSTEAMEAELKALPGKWRIYGTDIFPSGRNYHVEIHTTDVHALEIALDRLDVAPALWYDRVDGNNNVQDQMAPADSKQPTRRCGGPKPLSEP